LKPLTIIYEVDWLTDFKEEMIDVMAVQNNLSKYYNEGIRFLSEG
jgi:hypothetical protein